MTTVTHLHRHIILVQHTIRIKLSLLERQLELNPNLQLIISAKLVPSGTLLPLYLKQEEAALVYCYNKNQDPSNIHQIINI
jgi:hypothetical protein